MTMTFDATAERAHRAANQLHSILLLGGIGLVLVFSSWLVWGRIGILFAGLAVGAIALFSPRIPPDALMRLYKAQPVPRGSGGQLGDILDQLVQRSGLPARPALYVIPSMTLNAFTVGSPHNAAIGITEGLLRKLSMREIVGVMAHELAHIRNDDLSVMALADVMTRFLQSLSYVALFLAVVNIIGAATGEPTMSWTGIALLYLAPTISSLLQLGLSRTREYDADREAALMTGDPVALASALRRLERYTGSMWEDIMPVPARRIPVPSVLRTHPETSDRVARLLALGGITGEPAITVRDAPMVSMVGLGPRQLEPRYRFPGLWY